MNQSIRELERDIEESRARLDLTIERLQDKLSVSGVVDDTLGSLRAAGYSDVFDRASSVIRRNPVPVMLVAVGVGWLVYRMAQDEEARRRTSRIGRAEAVPLDAGRAGIDNRALPPLQPPADTVGFSREFPASRRDMNART